MSDGTISLVGAVLSVNTHNCMGDRCGLTYFVSAVLSVNTTQWVIWVIGNCGRRLLAYFVSAVLSVNTPQLYG